MTGRLRDEAEAMLLSAAGHRRNRGQSEVTSDYSSQDSEAGKKEGDGCERWGEV